MRVALVTRRSEKLEREVVEVTPFTREVRIPVVVAKERELVVEEVILERLTCFTSPVV